MVNAQKWLDKNYPKNGTCIIEKRKKYSWDDELEDNPNFGKTREEITSLDIKSEALEGTLNLSDFTNLEKLICWNNYLTLNLSNCKKLKEIVAYRNKITANLNIFSHLTELKELDLGINQANPELNNNFSGSLKALENCKDLGWLCVGYQPNVEGGLEYLPA